MKGELINVSESPNHRENVWIRRVEVHPDSIMRLQAHINADRVGLLANCENCGAPIPLELTRCDRCEHGQ